MRKLRSRQLILGCKNGCMHMRALAWLYEWVHAHVRACMLAFVKGQASEAKRNHECFNSVMGREEFLSLSTERCMLMVFSCMMNSPRLRHLARCSNMQTQQADSWEISEAVSLD